MEEKNSEESNSATPSYNRRRSRARRARDTRQLLDGYLEEAPQKERWSREARKPRLKKIREQAQAFERTISATVLEVHRRTCVVRLEDGSITSCRYRATVVEELGMFPAVGDQIILGITRENGEEQTFLVGVQARRSLLSRPGPEGRENQRLVLAANIDQVVVVISAGAPIFNYGFLDRFLLASSLCHLPLVVVCNKMDQVYAVPSEISDFYGLVLKVLPVSCVDGQGLDELISVLAGKASVFTGQSGVGKSSLANKLVPGLNLATGEIRERDGKGRHTTASSRLVNLPMGGWIVDTPGIRGLGVLDFCRADLANMFPGFFPSGEIACKFGNCMHNGEPECAVQKAVESGKISDLRYHSYLRILEECPA